MYILCDTSSILMLIRIAPEMFIAPQFNCATIPEAKREFVQTQKFKSKYPWKTGYQHLVTPLPTTDLRHSDYKLYYRAIKNFVEVGTINQKTGKFFDLSAVDQKIIAFAATKECKITTGDHNLIDFAEQQFSVENISPLNLVNQWLENGLVIWNTHLRTIIEDWDKCNEHPQPKDDIRRFERITKEKYMGI